MSNVGSVVYASSTTTTTDITLQTTSTFSRAVNGSDVVERFINLDPTAIAQVETITIVAVPVADAYYRVQIDDVGVNNDRTYTLEYLTASPLTTAQIATRLGELINSNPDIGVVVTGSTIVLTGATPGVSTGAFTCTVGAFAKADNTTIATRISTATTTPASGTGKVRKLVRLEIALAPSNGNPELRLTGIWYNGANPAVQASTFGPTPVTSSIKFDVLRNVA